MHRTLAFDGQQVAPAAVELQYALIAPAPRWILLSERREVCATDNSSVDAVRPARP